MKIYGLFKITWDYYSWEDLEVASDSTKSLENYYLERGDASIPLLSKDKSNKVIEKGEELFHYVIRRIELV